MTKVSASGEDLVFEVEGWDKLWSLRSRLVIPLQHVIRVYADANTAEKWWKGIRLAGTHVPGVIAAGTFYQHGGCVFGTYISLKMPSRSIFTTSTMQN